MLQKLQDVMIGLKFSSQLSQQLVWMVKVVFSNGSDQDLDQSKQDVALHCAAAAVIKPELHLESAIHQPIHNHCLHHQNQPFCKPICIEQCSSTYLHQSLPLSLERL